MGYIISFFNCSTVLLGEGCHIVLSESELLDMNVWDTLFHFKLFYCVGGMQCVSVWDIHTCVHS